MFDTGVRQFRMALGMIWGRRLNPGNIARLVGDALDTLAEFGEPGADVQALTDGPFADAEARRSYAASGVRRTARRLAKVSPFYARRFAAADIQPEKLDGAAMRRIPVTVKADLIRQGHDFLCAGATPHLATRTTGTTGKPAEIWLSRYEVELFSAVGALGGVLRGSLQPDDLMQVNVSSRATASVQLDVATLSLVGAGTRIVGLVPPDEALDNLADGTVSLLSSYPSYLGELETAARRRGMGPADFPRLRRIDTGGEVLSPSLARALGDMFGAEVNDTFAMTEVIPLTGRHCSQRHLHHDLTVGLVETLDLATGEPAEPGALATVVITPFYPYRECMPVFRYDTRDVVRVLPDAPLTCEFAGLPATSEVLGKADHLLRVGAGEPIAARQLVEAVEALPTRPWPARYRVAVESGRLVLTLPTSAVAGLDHAEAVRHFGERGLDVRLDLVPDAEATALRPTRSDLRETTFVTRPALIGA